jgi:hypothetical protein
MIELSNVTIGHKKVNAKIFGKRVCIISEYSSEILLSIAGKFFGKGKTIFYKEAFNDVQDIYTRNMQNIGLGIIKNVRPLYQELTVKENLEFYARMNKAKMKYPLMLKEIENKKIETLSVAGLATISFAIANMDDPEIILLDLTQPMMEKEKKIFWYNISPYIEDKIIIYAQSNEDLEADQILRI